MPSHSLASCLRPQDEARPLAAQHLERRHALDAEADAGIRDFDLLRRGRGDLVGDNRVPVGERMGYEVIVRDLEESVHGRRLVVLAGGPGADLAERGQHRGVRIDEETGAAVRGPRGELIAAGLDLVADLLDTEDPARRVVRDEPIPERRTEVEAIVQVLGLDEDVGVKQIRHQTITPRLRPSS